MLFEPLNYFQSDRVLFGFHPKYYCDPKLGAYFIENGVVVRSKPNWGIVHVPVTKMSDEDLQRMSWQLLVTAANTVVNGVEEAQLFCQSNNLSYDGYMEKDSIKIVVGEKFPGEKFPGYNIYDQTSNKSGLVLFNLN